MGFNNQGFVQVHNHTEYSRFDGLNKMGEFVLHARKMGFRSLGITDHGNIGGWIKFHKECAKKKDKNDKELVGADGKPLPTIKPILGCEFYLSRNLKEKNPDGRKGNRHLVLIAKNQEGYQNLCALSQKSWREGQYIDPRIDLNSLAEHSKGLICSSACLGSVVNINLLHGRYQQAKAAATILKDIFGKDFFLEVMYHGIDAEGTVVPEVIKLGQELDIPVIATNDCHYTRKDQAKSQEVLMAMSSSRCIKDPKRIHFPHDEFYLKSAEEMGKIFGSHPETLSNTVALAERVEDFLKLGGMRLPKFDIETAHKEIREVKPSRIAAVYAGFGDEQSEAAKKLVPAGMTPLQFLTELCAKGMRELGWENKATHIEALNMELADVKIAWENNRMDFATYFLIVWDYINFARKKGIITGCGRGSGYASVILRALGVCYGPDPIEYGLLWSRFLAFSFEYVLLDTDWGFGEEAVVVLESDELLNEVREAGEDEGGIDRY